MKNNLPAIKIHSVRLGMATNSSSSHSLIWLDPTEHNLETLESRDFKQFTSGEIADGQFGWEDFTLSTIVDKLTYFTAIVENGLYSLNSPKWLKNVIIKELTGFDSISSDTYIDHQSMLCLPVDYHNTDYFDMEFAKAVRDWFLQDGLVVLGGNDNGYDGHYLLNASESISSPISDNAGLVVRYDEIYDYWTMYNKHSGAKIRFSFNEENIKPVKAFAPELVDLKITDYCDYNCSFCYMGSTKEGKHADTSYIYSVLSALSKLKVFEIALGGGEPTEHPDFLDILEHGKKLGLTMNFTTKNADWLYDDEKREAVLESSGAFAFSVQSVYEFNRIADAVKYHRIDRKRVKVHIVMGTISKRVFKDLLETSYKTGILATLLGFKKTGRGSEYNVKNAENYDWWLDVWKEVSNNGDKHIPITVDTVMIQLFSDKFEEYGIPRWLYHTQDGTFSAYIDAVKKLLLPASYIDKPALIKLSGKEIVYGQLPDNYFNIDSEELAKTFRGFSTHYPHLYETNDSKLK